MVHGERNVGVQCFADGFAVINRFGIGETLKIGFQTVGNFQQDVGALG